MLLSFLMLFVELALIRWTGSNVLYLSYFSNFVLLASFLGIGVGFLRARARTNLFGLAPAALALLVGFVLIFPVEIDRSGSELIYFGAEGRTGLPPWLTLPVLFVAVATVMAMIGQGVARAFVTFPPLEAYRLDILGSIAGIAAFSLLSFAGAPPLAWGLMAGLAFGMLYGRGITLLQGAGVMALLVMLGLESAAPSDSWSPYYKIRLRPTGNDAVNVFVNGVSHQTIESIERLQRLLPLYFLPYQRALSPPDDVLIVGTGTGNDVAVALAEHARHVDAVEIDPRLYQLGVRRHPDHPYQDPRVSRHIDDGRAFLQRTDRRYDLILFALPDSLTLVAGQASLRLESYLFTQEAMRQARAHLKPGGVFAEYNYYREPWLVDRLALTLERVYGHPPCVDSVGQVGGLALLTTSVDPGAVRCQTVWSPGAAAVPEPASDDYPFPYLRDRRLPGFYLLTIGLILLATVAMVRLAGGPLRPMTAHADLLFMGAAFLLLETRNIVQFALLFGTTWFVNALVFLGVLLSVLAAVEVAGRMRPGRPRVLYAALLASLVLAWAVPPHLVLALPLLPRFALATLLAFIPIFIANLVFAQRFQAAGASDLAFGANLLGAMIGGLLEYSALMLGYRALFPVIAVLYGLAFVSGRRQVRVARRLAAAA